MADGATLVNENQHTNGDTSKPASNIAAIAKFERGDVKQGFADADVVVESEHRVPTAHQGYIEPHACTATVNEDGKATIWCCTQGHFEVRSLTAAVLGERVGNIKGNPFGNRWRLRRQNHHLSGAAGREDGADVRTPGEKMMTPARRCSAPPGQRPPPGAR